MLDRAGCHLSGAVAVPDNITPLPLPPKCPELNVMENVWRFMRDNWLSNRVFQAYEAILDCRLMQPPAPRRSRRRGIGVIGGMGRARGPTARAAGRRGGGPGRHGASSLRCPL
jgi:DDE superfamily endonuclease